MTRILVTIEDMDDRAIESTTVIEGNNTVQYIRDKLLTSLSPNQNRILVDGVEWGSIEKRLVSDE